LSDQQAAQVWRMVSAKVAPRAIVDFMAGEGCNMIANDVANLTQRRFSGMDTASCKDMAGFIVYLEAHAYEVRWCLDMNDRVVALFFTHQKCIQLARKFNEVVIMDATYKTNQLKLPFINMVGVNNIGCNDKTLSTFAIAGAWITAENESSYTWVLEQLNNTVYLDGKWKPALFVTDQETALVNGIESIFSTSQHILCYVHLSKNLKTNTAKYFTSVEEFDKADRFFKRMCLAATRDAFDCAHDSLMSLALKSTNDKGAGVKAFLSR
ncbi:hypothetical protein, partial, partial [Absidia glauca]